MADGHIATVLIGRSRDAVSIATGNVVKRPYPGRNAGGLQAFAGHHGPGDGKVYAAWQRNLGSTQPTRNHRRGVASFNIFYIALIGSFWSNISYGSAFGHGYIRESDPSNASVVGITVEGSAGVRAEPRLAASGSVDAATVSAEPPASEHKPKPSFPPPAALPTQEGPHGFRFDFNFGARLKLPEGNYRARLRDADTGNILFEVNRGGVTMQSSKRFYVRFGLEVWDDAGTLILQHDYDARVQEVLVTLPVGTLGDSMGWFPYAVRF